jgi:hypothetical protein
MRPMSPCVYTVLLGQYEQLNEQPVAHESDWRFICFTDDPTLTSTTWQVRLVEPLFAADLSRSQRQIKHLAHRFLPEHDVSLYIDNSVLMKVPPEEILAQWPLTSGFALCAHSFRETVLDEFLEVLRLGYDDQARLLEHLNHVQWHHPDVLAAKPMWSGVMLRRHHEPKIKAAMELWFQHVLRYSRRDQLSSNLAFAQCDLKPDLVEESNLSSWCHSWPHVSGRDRLLPAFNPQTLQLPGLARVRQSELAQVHCEAQLSQCRSQLLEASSAHVAAMQCQQAAHEAVLKELANERAKQLKRAWFTVPKPKFLR